MGNNKQSSIDWLIGQLKAQYDIDIERLAVTDKSKAMHKEEIVDATKIDLGFNYPFAATDNDAAEQYYNETYKQD